ncbi:hypothetical protein AAC387_Pa02g4774 [Persea americana]
MPMHWKPCFAYCSLFPEGYELVKLWMAQGFIKSEGSKELEEIGEAYFDDLLWYSLFQGAEYDDDGNITQFKMLGLVHDIAQHITESEYCTVDNEKLDHISVKSCHFSFISYNMSSFSSLSNKLENSRTLLVLGGAIGDSMPIDWFDQTKFLRALDLSGSKELPESLVNLSDLQTLKLKSLYLCKILEGISKLVSLRHFEIDNHGMAIPNCIPKRLGQLISLRTLREFYVLGEDGYKIGQLGNLNLL